MCLTLLEFYETCYRLDRHPQKNQLATRETMRTELRKFERLATISLGRPPLIGDLSDELIKLAMAAISESGQSAHTANKLLRHVKCVWALAVQHGLLANACRAKPLRTLHKSPVAFNVDELMLLVRAAEAMAGALPRSTIANCDWWPALILFLFSTGSRVTAALKTPTGNYDLANGVVKIPAAVQKHRTDEIKYLLPSARAALNRLGPWKRGIPLLFGDWSCGVRALRKHFYRLQVDAGLYANLDAVPVYETGFHRIRRTTATCVYNSAGLHAASEYLSHSATSVTAMYLDERMMIGQRSTDLLPDPFGLPGVGTSGA